MAQQKNSEDDLQRLEEKYKKFKDLSAEHPFVPAVSTVMINYSKVEINFFNSLLSANKFRDNSSHIQDLPFRETYLFNTIQLTYGLSKKAKFNIGLDVNYSNGRIDYDRYSSIFKIFNPAVTGNSTFASAITSFAPRIRWRPLRKNYSLTIQNSLILPVSLSDAKQSILGSKQVFFATQFLYNHPLNYRMFLFSQLGVQYGFYHTNTPSVLYTPIALYASYLIHRKTIPFLLINYIPIFSKNNNRTTFQAGAGIQYQFSKSFLINGYYTKDILGKNYPAFNNYNLSLRYTNN